MAISRLSWLLPTSSLTFRVEGEDGEAGALPPLGEHKQLKLLAEMVMICPRGEENYVFFNYHFLRKLHRELRIL